MINTQYLPRVAEVYNRRGQDKPDMINRDADGGFSQSEDGQTDTASYIGVMTQLPVQDQNIKVQLNVNCLLRNPFPHRCHLQKYSVIQPRKQ